MLLGKLTAFTTASFFIQKQAFPRYKFNKDTIQCEKTASEKQVEDLDKIFAS